MTRYELTLKKITFVILPMHDGGKSRRKMNVVKDVIFVSMDKKRKQRVISRLILAAWLLVFSSVIVHGKAALSKKRVCVIGAGPSGLTSLKQLIDNIDQFEPVVFEKKSDVGGQWLYTDDVSDDQFGLPVQSSVYANLRTNGPREILAFPDYQHFSSPEQRSCVRRQEVFQYLQNFTDQYNLRQYIRFNTLVENVTPENSTSDQGDWMQSKWRIMARDANANKQYQIVCDATIVCNGINSKPLVTNIPGIESFPGRVLHSHVYRKPEEFAGQTILLLGAGDSAVDLALELSPNCPTIYLSHRSDKLPGDFPANVNQVSTVVSVNGTQIILQDGSKVDVDTFIFCTGYVQDLAFLGSDSGVQVQEKSVDNLYKYIVNIEHPSMGFVGVAGSSVLTFARFYLQAQYYVALLGDKTTLPSKSDMFQDESNIISQGENYTEWNYYVDLADVGSLKPLSDFYERGITLWLTIHRSDRVHFKEYNMHISNNGDIEYIRPS